MSLRTVDRLPGLYEQDETAWLEAMAELIREGRLEELDYPHLGEFLEDMAKRDRREVKNRLVILLAHLLKWTHQPDWRSKSWRLAVLEQRRQLADIFESATLRHHAEAVLPKVHTEAVRQAALETGLSESVFPAVCPYTLDDLERPDLLPE